MSSRKLALALTAFALAGFGSLMGMRDSLSWTTGDEGTYMAMAASLAYDGDLLFTALDIERVEAAESVGERNLILQRTDLGITYSKPVVYPLLASPFTRIAGRYGPVLLNTLALTVALWLAFQYLRRADTAYRRLLLATFVGTSALVPYLVWRMSDSLVASCVLAGLVLALAGARRWPDKTPPRSALLDGPAAPVLGGLLLGLASAMRYPNALLPLAALVGLALMRERRQALLVLGGLAIAVATVASATMLLTGAIDPYKATRSTFDPAIGYPDSVDSPVAERQFGGLERATFHLQTRPKVRTLAYSSLYFLIGRHTGLLVYFPAAILLFVLALRRPDRIGLALLGAVVGIAFFYLYFLPHNYFGGAAAIGNRYFMAAYPALLIAQREIPNPRWLIAPWVIALAAIVSALWSVGTVSAAQRTSQAHAHGGIFRLLPYESTLQTIEGSKERFWLHDWGWEMLHFNDPFQRLGAYSFTLEAGRPPTEIEVANTREDGKMRFLVASQSEKLLLDYSDWLRSETFELERPIGERGLIEIDPAPAWRRHPFWFHFQPDDNFNARIFRLALRTPDGSPGAAVVRYLGQADIPTEIYSYELVSGQLPTLAGAGTTSSAAVTVLNASSEPWKSNRVLGVFLSYKLFYRVDGVVKSIEGPRTPLPHAVAPGEIFSAEIDISWPGAARNYGLSVDLVHEGIAWFEKHNASPLARSEVRVIQLPQAEPDPMEPEPAPESRESATGEAAASAEETTP